VVAAFGATLDWLCSSFWKIKRGVAPPRGLHNIASHAQTCGADGELVAAHELEPENGIIVALFNRTNLPVTLRDMSDREISPSQKRKLAKVLLVSYHAPDLALAVPILAAVRPLGPPKTSKCGICMSQCSRRCRTEKRAELYSH
jgi:hypothetical protein